MLHEKVCVPCALNRNGLSIAKITNLGLKRLIFLQILCLQHQRKYCDRGRTDLAYTDGDGKHHCPFGRIIIKNKKVYKDED